MYLCRLSAKDLFPSSSLIIVTNNLIIRPPNGANISWGLFVQSFAVKNCMSNSLALANPLLDKSHDKLAPSVQQKTVAFRLSSMM